MGRRGNVGSKEKTGIGKVYMTSCNRKIIDIACQLNMIAHIYRETRDFLSSVFSLPYLFFLFHFLSF